MNTVRLIIGLVILFVVVVIALFNMDQHVMVRLASSTPYARVGLVILVSWLAGVVSCWLIAILGEIRLRTRLASQKRETELLMRELNDLRNLPVNAEDEVKVEAATEEKQ